MRADWIKNQGAVRFRSRLQDNGLTTEQTDRLVCPIGIEQVTGSPLQVALSITAQLYGWMRASDKINGGPEPGRCRALCHYAL